MDIRTVNASCYLAKERIFRCKTKWTAALMLNLYFGYCSLKNNEIKT